MEGTDKNTDLLNSNEEEGVKEDFCHECEIATENDGKQFFCIAVTSPLFLNIH